MPAAPALTSAERGGPFPHPISQPSFGPVLRTPCLAIRPAWDEDIALITDAAVMGIHPEDEMPFSSPWWRKPRPELPSGTTRSVWNERVSRKPEQWSLSFAVRRVDADIEAWWEAPVIGRQDLIANHFPLLRTAETGSWLTASAQGAGTRQGDAPRRRAVRL